MDSWLKIAWRDMGPWKWIGVAAIAISLFLTPFNAQGREIQAAMEHRSQRVVVDVHSFRAGNL